MCLLAAVHSPPLLQIIASSAKPFFGATNRRARKKNAIEDPFQATFSASAAECATALSAEAGVFTVLTEAKTTFISDWFQTGFILVCPWLLGILVQKKGGAKKTNNAIPNYEKPPWNTKRSVWPSGKMPRFCFIKAHCKCQNILKHDDLTHQIRWGWGRRNIISISWKNTPFDRLSFFFYCEPPIFLGTQ